MNAVVEMHYTVPEICLLIRKAANYVRRKIKAGDFGTAFFIDGDYIVPASGVNAFLQRHKLGSALGVKARSEGELRRKVSVATARSGEFGV